MLRNVRMATAVRLVPVLRCIGSDAHAFDVDRDPYTVSATAKTMGTKSSGCYSVKYAPVHDRVSKRE